MAELLLGRLNKAQSFGNTGLSLTWLTLSRGPSILQTCCSHSASPHTHSATTRRIEGSLDVSFVWDSLTVCAQKAYPQLADDMPQIDPVLLREFGGGVAPSSG